MPSSASANTVGKETLAYCTSCKMDLGHTIVAMKGDRVAKVHCRTCKKEHAYKPPKGVTEPPKDGETKASGAKRARSSAAAEESSPVEVEWQKLMNQTKASVSKPYGVKTKFELGDKIKHPTFGEGVVMKQIYPNKVEVIFQMDVKLLIHGGA